VREASNYASPSRGRNICLSALDIQCNPKLPLLYVPTLSYILVKESCSRIEQERNYYYLSEDSSLGLVLLAVDSTIRLDRKEYALRTAFPVLTYSPFRLIELAVDPTLFTFPTPFDAAGTDSSV